jgi:uncharacterized damage-inducible protein DinB
MLETATLNALILEAFSGKITWFEAASRYPVEEFIDSYYRTRAAMQRTVSDITDAQASYTAQGNPTWSISETVSHLIYSQGFYYNQLLEITTSQLPHLVEAAKGFGEGAQRGLPADELRRTLHEATIRIEHALKDTLMRNDAARINNHWAFGKVNYQTWVLLLLAHESDHVRQSIIMRRLARAVGR